MCASVFTLMAIAGDRFFAITFPIKSRMSPRNVTVVNGVVWVSAAVIGSPALFVYTYTERQWENYKEMFCSDNDWPAKEVDKICDWGLSYKKAFWTIVCVVLNWVPMVVMTILYSIILVQLRYNRIMPSSGALSISARQQKSKRKVSYSSD